MGGERGLVIIDERRWRTKVEQTRFPMAGATGFEWMIGRWSCATDSGREGDVAIGRLLKTMARIAADRLPGP